MHPDRFKPLDVWCEEHRRTRILEQWDYDANGGKGPHDCVCRSGRPVHWRCPDCGFEWVEAPARRTGRSFDDCLACADVALVPGKNDLATVRPDIAEEWHPTRLSLIHIFTDAAEHAQWLARVVADADLSLVGEGFDFSSVKSVVTLCTCSYNRWGNERTLVICAVDAFG